MIEITEREDNLVKEEKEDNKVKEEKKEIIMIEDPMSSEVTDRKEDMGDIKDSTVGIEREENMKEERKEEICMKTKSTPNTKDSKVIDLLDNMIDPLDNMIDPLDNMIDHLDNMRDQDLPKVMNLMSIEEEEVQEEPEDKEVLEEEPEEVTETTSETENIMKETNTINIEMTIENMAIEITKDTKNMIEDIDEEQ